MSAVGRRRLLLLAINNLTFGLDADQVLALVRAEELIPSDAFADAVGIVTYLDEPAPVFPLAVLFGVTDVPATEGVIVLLNAVGLVCGLLVERVRVEEIDEGSTVQAFPATTGPARGWFREILCGEDRLLPILHPPGVLGAEPPPLEAPQRLSAIAADCPLVSFAIAQTDVPNRPVRIAVSSAQVIEVMRAGRVVSIPGLAAHELGLFAWRRQALIVVDVAARLGCSRLIAPKRFVILEIALGRRVAVPGDQVHLLEATTAAAEAIRGVEVNPAFIERIVETATETLVLPRWELF